MMCEDTNIGRIVASTRNIDSDSSVWLLQMISLLSLPFLNITPNSPYIAHRLSVIFWKKEVVYQKSRESLITSYIHLL